MPFDIQLFDRPDVMKLLAGSNVFTGFNTRLDIFTALEPEELSSLLDGAYHEAEKKAEEFANDPENKRRYESASQFHIPFIAPPSEPKAEYLEGPKGPPLSKSKSGENPAHQILKTIAIRDYDYPTEDYAYSRVRRHLLGYEGHFFIFPFSKNSEINVIPDSIHDRIDFEPKSDAVLFKFVLGMINLEGNYTPAALEAKMGYAASTTEQGKSQRDALQKLGNFFHDREIPFYATLHNLHNAHSVLIYGLNSNGNSIDNTTSKTKELPPSSINI